MIAWAIAIGALLIWVVVMLALGRASRDPLPERRDDLSGVDDWFDVTWEDHFDRPGSETDPYEQFMED